jgi:hypothetical protein
MIVGNGRYSCSILHGVLGFWILDSRPCDVIVIAVVDIRPGEGRRRWI